MERSTTPFRVRPPTCNAIVEYGESVAPLAVCLALLHSALDDPIDSGQHGVPEFIGALHGGSL